MYLCNQGLLQVLFNVFFRVSLELRRARRAAHIIYLAIVFEGLGVFSHDYFFSHDGALCHRAVIASVGQEIFDYTGRLRWTTGAGG